MGRPDDNKLKNLLLEQYEKYPLSQDSDMLKLLYQSEFGCGHMAPDKARSLDMIIEEAGALPQTALKGDVFDYIGNGLCRLHLRVLRQGALLPDTLSGFFMHTANQSAGNAESFEKKAMVLLGLCKSEFLPFEANEVSKILEENRVHGYPAMGHSQQFRDVYTPAYRVVSKVFCDFLPLFCRIDQLRQLQKTVTVAIDGNSAAGKSSFVALLKSIYSCNVFTMDDFFLRPSQRTPNRLSEPGGNIDYERFCEEVLAPLKSGEAFTYRPYSCRTGELTAPVSVTPNPINVIEGVYSLHPRFDGEYDVKVFMGLSEEQQRRRLLERNPNLYDRFVCEWLPMEKMYFEQMKIPDKCDFVFDTGLQYYREMGGPSESRNN